MPACLATWSCGTHTPSLGGVAISYFIQEKERKINSCNATSFSIPLQQANQNPSSLAALLLVGLLVTLLVTLICAALLVLLVTAVHLVALGLAAIRLVALILAVIRIVALFLVALLATKHETSRQTMS